RPVGRVALAAGPQEQLVARQAVPERGAVGVDVGAGLVPGLHSLVRHVHSAVRIVVVWIEHIEGETSSPPCPVDSATWASGTWRSPAWPRSWVTASAKPTASPRCQLESSPPPVLTGMPSPPGAVAPEATNLPPSPFSAQP